MNVDMRGSRRVHRRHDGWLSRARGLDALRWLGLVAGALPARHDELASQSLTADRSGDDPAHWIA